MARQRDSKLVGTIQNLIFYNHRGDYRMRTKPVSVKRTAASVKSGYNFGKASKMSKQIRSLITGINPTKSDSRAMYRFTGALNKILCWKEKRDPSSPLLPNEVPYITGFQFNDRSDLTSMMAVRVSVKSDEAGLLEIRLAPLAPVDDLQAPFNTDHILFKIVLTGTSMTDVKTEKLGETEIEIPYNREIFRPSVISIPVTTNPDRLTVIILAVQYLVNKKSGTETLSDLKKLPCGVLWAGWI
jgi:hypothetical protein